MARSVPGHGATCDWGIPAVSPKRTDAQCKRTPRPKGHRIRHTLCRADVSRTHPVAPRRTASACETLPAGTRNWPAVPRRNPHPSAREDGNHPGFREDENSFDLLLNPARHLGVTSCRNTIRATPRWNKSTRSRTDNRLASATSDAKDPSATVRQAVGVTSSPDRRRRPSRLAGTAAGGRTQSRTSAGPSRQVRCC